VFGTRKFQLRLSRVLGPGGVSSGGKKIYVPGVGNIRLSHLGKHAEEASVALATTPEPVTSEVVGFAAQSSSKALAPQRPSEYTSVTTPVSEFAELKNWCSLTPSGDG